MYVPIVSLRETGMGTQNFYFVKILRGCSSAGRALPRQGKGQGFDPPHLQKFRRNFYIGTDRRVPERLQWRKSPPEADGSEGPRRRRRIPLTSTNATNLNLCTCHPTGQGFLFWYVPNCWVWRPLSKLSCVVFRSLYDIIIRQ